MPNICPSNAMLVNDKNDGAGIRRYAKRNGKI